MHELSLALKLVELACEQAALSKEMDVIAIHISVGALVQVHEQSLRSGFAVAKEGTILSDAELIIRHVPLLLACSDCNRIFEASGLQDLRCPSCQGYSTQVQQGNELELEFLTLRPRSDNTLSGGTLDDNVSTPTGI